MSEQEYRIDDSVFKARLRKFTAKLSDKISLYTKLAAQSQTEMEQNFDRQSDSKGSGWEPLSPATLAIRRNKNKSTAKILQDTGRLRRLGFQLLPNGFKTGTSVNYGQIHNEGGSSKMFGKKSVQIPRREWAYLNDSALKKIKLTLDGILKGAF